VEKVGGGELVEEAMEVGGGRMIGERGGGGDVMPNMRTTLEELANLYSGCGGTHYENHAVSTCASSVAGDSLKRGPWSSVMSLRVLFIWSLHTLFKDTIVSKRSIMINHACNTDHNGSVRNRTRQKTKTKKLHSNFISLF
jgi:hypothetical protein